MYQLYLPHFHTHTQCSYTRKHSQHEADSLYLAENRSSVLQFSLQLRDCTLNECYFLYNGSWFVSTGVRKSRVPVLSICRETWTINRLCVSRAVRRETWTLMRLCVSHAVSVDRHGSSLDCVSCCVCRETWTLIRLCVSRAVSVERLGPSLESVSVLCCECRRSSVSQETQDDPAPISCGLNLAKVISVGGVQTKLLSFLGGRSPTLDTNSAHNRLQISSDLRTVMVSGVPQSRPHHPHRFDVWGQALCSESFSSGQHYWEVDVGSVELCRVGVAYGTIPRRGSGDECLLGGNDVSWCLQKLGDSFSVHHGGVVTSLSVPEPQGRVGVHLDWDAGLLSFYSADSMAPLHSFHQTFDQPLHPGLLVGWGKFGDSVRIVDLSGAS
uniref:Zinc-binding protein A33-like isoform X1 n=1 Tax=Petromyzon marinus TaxID=7757 RepID=A0AAJ7UG84_PETMA|nr:zinc-binding protein A33-like isoform X1 [Petromyzon marinus]